MSAPQIAVQAASPMTQSPASGEESDDEDRDGSAADGVQITSGDVEDQELELGDFSEMTSGSEITSGHVGDQELGLGKDSTILDGLEMDSEVVKPADDVGQPVPDDVEEDKQMEGRLSADTSEQIFISQQIEAKAATVQQEPGETGFTDDHVTPGLDESEHGEVPDRSPDAANSCLLPRTDIDQLQSPEKTSIGIHRHCRNSGNFNSA